MNDANAIPVRRTRLGCEWRAFVGLWLWPLLVALLPYRVGIAFARWLARTLPLYDDMARPAVRHWRSVQGGGDEGEWLANFRFALLIDHADLFWALTRSEGFLLKRLHSSGVVLPEKRPLIVLSFHYGQGLWLLRWLREHGVRPRFVSVPSVRASADSTLMFLYGRLRIRVVERLSGAAPIYLGGARRTIATALKAGDTVYGLVDVPVRGAGAQAGNCTMFAAPLLLPTGLLETAGETAAAAIVLTARVQPDGDRLVDMHALEHVNDRSMPSLARELERRIRLDSPNWHFWYLWGSFVALPTSSE